ncbi:hypothetical protein NBG84_15140 [Streptomyces sp. CWNU-1]|uniref:Integral membrane protein n=2 Tax=Streptomyces albipurpureus TaxID=2897419 RepID=A0ABT0UMQ8_9ACTN|nr:hypothetical protein [Streptomyces sp. CWNU-1]
MQGAPQPTGGADLPHAVRFLRGLMLAIGGIQGIIGLAMVTNSVDIATAIWGERPDRLFEKSHENSGLVVFFGVLMLVMAAWAIATSLRFGDRHPGLLASTRAYGWALLAVVLFLGLFISALGLVFLIPAILLVVRSRKPEFQSWFDRRPH